MKKKNTGTTFPEYPLNIASQTNTKGLKVTTSCKQFKNISVICKKRSQKRAKAKTTLRTRAGRSKQTRTSARQRQRSPRWNSKSSAAKCTAARTSKQ